MKRLLFPLAIVALALPTVHGGQIMFGVNGGHPNPDGSPLSINNGWLVIVDQTTGAVTPIGHPAGVAKMSGLAFEPNGDLFGAALSSVAFRPRLQVRQRRIWLRSILLPGPCSPSSQSRRAGTTSRSPTWRCSLAQVCCSGSARVPAATSPPRATFIPSTQRPARRLWSELLAISLAPSHLLRTVPYT